MKRIEFFFVIAMTISRVLLAQGPAAPQVTCEQPTFDFGTVADVPEIQHTFVLKNTGNASLEITRVRPACGCTTAALAKNSLGAGESTEVSARLSLAGRTGAMSKAIYVESNDPKNPAYKLELVGVVQRNVDWRPQQAVLQRSAADPAPKSEIRILFNGPTAHTVTAVESNGASFWSTTLNEITPGHEYALVVQALTNLPTSSAYFNGEIVVVTDDPSKPRIQIPVVITQVRDVIVAPNQLMLPAAVPAGTPVQQQILIRNRTTNALEIVGVEVPSNQVTFVTKKLSEAMYRVDLTFMNPQLELNGQKVTVLVRRQGAAEERYDVPIQILPAQSQ